MREFPQRRIFDSAIALCERGIEQKDNNMKTIMKSVLVAGIAALTVTPLFAKPHGDVLQFSIKEPMTNNGVEPSASGTVQASQSEQGNANNQKIAINVAGLTPNTGYSLFASTTDNNDSDGHFGFYHRQEGQGQVQL